METYIIPDSDQPVHTITSLHSSTPVVSPHVHTPVHQAPPTQIPVEHEVRRTDTFLNQHSYSILLVGTTLVSILIGLFVGFGFGSKSSPMDSLVRQPVNQLSALPAAEQENTFCTMDTKLCQDGSSVGRSGPTCQFALCPEEVGEAAIPQNVVASSSGNVVAQTSGTCSNPILNLKATLPSNTPNWTCESDQTELLFTSTSGVHMLFSNQEMINPCGPGSTCTLQTFYQGNGLILNSYLEDNILIQVYGAFADGTWAMITWPEMDAKPLAVADKNQLMSILSSLKKGASTSATSSPLR